MLEGIVTSVNTNLCSFTLQNGVIVYLPHLFLSKHIQGLSEVGEYVKIGNHYHQASNDLKCIYLCEKSSITYHSMHCIKTIKCHLLEVLKKYELQVYDIVDINKYVIIIKERFPKFTIALVNYVVVSILQNLAELFTMRPPSNCFQRKLPKYSLQTVFDCQYVDANNERYREFPNWSFGIHHRNKPSDILIGYLFISDVYGIPFIKDDKHIMPCCIIAHNNKDLAKINEKLILIRKCYIFTEIFNEPDVGTLEYMICHMEDIFVFNVPTHVLRCTNNANTVKFYEKKPADIISKYMLEFILLARSSIISIENQQAQVFLKILVLNGKSKRIEYLSMNSLSAVTLLDIGNAYALHHNQNLISYSCGELQRVQQPDTNLYSLSDPSAIITCSSLTENHINTVENIWTVDEVEELIQTSSKMLSFQGVICTKEFVKRLDSRTAIDIVTPGFGTLGNQTHVLHFFNSMDVIAKFYLYINNWESILMPLGMLPGMRLLVRNVLPEKGGYLKCTLLTTFTILDYEPAVYFETINLHNNFYGYGGLSYLGSGQDIPSSVLVKARVFDVRIQSLSLRCSCKMCKKRTPCLCVSPELDAQVSLSFTVNDQEGPALVISKSISVLKILLGLNDFSWGVFLKTLPSLMLFNYNEFVPQNIKATLLDEILQHSLDTWYSISLTKLELICRKLDSHPMENNGLPMWYCVHAKLLLS